MFDCDRITIVVTPQAVSLPTISAERSKLLDFHFSEPGAMGSIYTIQCSQVSVHFQPPHAEKTELPQGEEGRQSVTRYQNNQLTSEFVIRGELVHVLLCSHRIDVVMFVCVCRGGWLCHN